MARVESHRLVERGERLLVRAALVERVAEVEPGVRELGLQLARLAVARDRLLHPAGLRERVAEVEADGRLGGPQPRRAAQRRDSLLRVVRLQEGDAEQVQRVGLVGRCLQRTPVAAYGLVQSPSLVGGVGTGEKLRDRVHWAGIVGSPAGAGARGRGYLIRQGCVRTPIGCDRA